MTSLIQKSKKIINEMGVTAFLLYTLSKILNKLNKKSGIHYYLFVYQEISLAPRLPPHRGKNFTFDILTEYSNILDALPRPQKVIQERFNLGYSCITAKKDGVFVGCIWISLHSYIEDEVRSIYTPQPSGKVAWDFDVFIDPGYRATYLFPKLWDETDAYLRRLGFEATASRISGFNAQSINSHTKLGAEIIGKAIYITIGRLQMSLSSLSPFLHVSFKETSVPEYKL